MSQYGIPESFLNGPSIAPPPGVVPNLIDPPNRNGIAYGIIIACIVLSAILYAVRAYAKFLSRIITVSDYLTLISFPLYWIYIYYSWRGTYSPGFLVHQWDVALKDVPKFSYVAYTATLLYLVIITLIKCAILFDWTSIFSSHGQRFFAWTCYITAFLFTSFATILFTLDFISCTPVQKNWNPLIPGTCRWSIPKSVIASAAVNFGLDLLPLILAQNIIWNLHATWQKKLGVSLIFLVGIAVLVSSIVRLYYASKFLKDSTDSTYDFYIVGICTLVETTCGNIVLCIPFLPKATKGLKQTQGFMKLSQYLRSRGSKAESAPDSYSESKDKFKPKPREQLQWIRMPERERGVEEGTRSSDDSFIRREGQGSV